MNLFLALVVALLAIGLSQAEAKSRKVYVYERGRKVETLRVYPHKTEVYVRGRKVRTYRERR